MFSYSRYNSWRLCGSMWGMYPLQPKFLYFQDKNATWIFFTCLLEILGDVFIWKFNKNHHLVVHFLISFTKKSDALYILWFKNNNEQVLIWNFINQFVLTIDNSSPIVSAMHLEITCVLSAVIGFLDIGIKVFFNSLKTQIWSTSSVSEVVWVTFVMPRIRCLKWKFSLERFLLKDLQQCLRRWGSK